MSRKYYTKYKEGKFCFAKQPSDTPEKFGMHENENIINYTVGKNDFNYSYLDKLIEKVFNEKVNSKDLSEEDIDNYIDELDENEKYWKLDASCDLYLGLIILYDLNINGYCDLEAET